MRPETPPAPEPTPALPAANTRKQKTIREQIVGTARKTLFYITLAWGSIWGGAMGYDNVIGDGPRPTLNNVVATHGEAAKKNTTSHLVRQIDPAQPAPAMDELWAQLQPTFNILKDLSPEVHDWAQQMYRSGKIRYVHVPMAGSPNIAVFDVVSRDLRLFKSFFTLNDGEKAACLVHEYWHSRQNYGKHLARLLSPKTLFAPFIEMGASWAGRPYPDGALIYGSKVEDEAHLLELQANQAIGLPGAGPREYLRERGLCCNKKH